MKDKIEEKKLKVLKIKEKIKAVEEEFEIEKAEIEKKYNPLIMKKEKEIKNLEALYAQEVLERDQILFDRFDSFIKEDGEIEVKYLNDSDYLEYLRGEGVDVKRINESEYRIFLESKGVKFLTEDISNEKESVGFRVDKEKELEALKVSIGNDNLEVLKIKEAIKELELEVLKIKESTKKYDSLIMEKEKVIEALKVSIGNDKEEQLENFIKEDGEIELKYLNGNDIVYVDELRICYGIDVERINELEYRTFLESKGVKFITEEETNKRIEAQKLKMEEVVLADDLTMIVNEKDLDLVGDHIEHQND
jgi:hypothetical protein